MGTGTLIKNRTDFENLIQTQVKKGQDLLNRNISEDSTTIINKRVGYVFNSKEYDRVEIEKFRSDYIKWDELLCKYLVVALIAVLISCTNSSSINSETITEATNQHEEKDTIQSILDQRKATSYNGNIFGGLILGCLKSDYEKVIKKSLQNMIINYILKLRVNQDLSLFVV